MGSEYCDIVFKAFVESTRPYSNALSEIIAMTRPSPITQRLPKHGEIISSSLSYEDFLKLERHCRKLAKTKSEIIRSWVKQELDKLD